MHDHWIADRMRSIEVSGIRKVFEAGRHCSRRHRGGIRAHRMIALLRLILFCS